MPEPSASEPWQRPTFRELLRRYRAFRRHSRARPLEARPGTSFTFGNSLIVHPGGRDTFEAMARAIASARRSIAIEMYTWADDRLGGRIAELVAAASRRGVRAYVLLDAFGSLGSGGIAQRLESAGASVRWYHPLVGWGPSWFPNRRDHRKLLVVDGRIAFVGGQNFDERYTDEFAGNAAWTDLSIAIQGPATQELVREFVAVWVRSGGAAEAAGELAGTAIEPGVEAVEVLGARGVRGRRRLRRVFAELLRSARERIFVANAYFAPESFLVRSLVRAARRGTRVELLLPGETDVPWVRWAGRSLYATLLAAGVQIREHDRGVLHAKVAVIDDRILLAGSANLDHRSFRHNLEIAVVAVAPESARRARLAFADALETARRIDLEAWRARGWRDRLLEGAAWSLRYWL